MEIIILISECSPTASYVLVGVTAYSITSDYLDGNSCATTRGNPISLSHSLLEITSPVSFSSSDLNSALAASIASALSLTSCDNGGQLTPLLPVYVSNMETFIGGVSIGASETTTGSVTDTSKLSARPSSSPVSSDNITLTTPQAIGATSITSSDPSPTDRASITIPQKTGIGVSVIAGLFFCLLIGWLLLRRWRRRQTATSKEAEASETKQPYLQPKAELDDDENRIMQRHEIEAQNAPMPELDDRVQTQEELEGAISSAELGDRVPVRRRQELQGQDGSSELFAGREGTVADVRQASLGGPERGGGDSEARHSNQYPI